MRARDWAPLLAGMAVAGAASVMASASTLAALARGAGWVGWTPWLLPASLDVAAAVGVWCWLRPGIPDRARAFAKTVAVVGSIGTLVGNGAGHLIETSFLRSSPILVVIVGGARRALTDDECKALMRWVAHVSTAAIDARDGATSLVVVVG